MAADTDVAIAWKRRWDAIPELSEQVPGGLHQEPMPKAPKDQNPIARPYATFMVKQDPGRKNDYTSGADYIDYRRVSLQVFGVGKEAIGDVVSLVHNTFRSTRANIAALAIPNTVAHVRTELVTEEIMTDETGPVQSEDIQRATFEFTVWSHRNEG